MRRRDRDRALSSRRSKRASPLDQLNQLKTPRQSVEFPRFGGQGLIRRQQLLLG